ncbi:MAG: cytochrome b/b6 domain-containing protein [Gammaproteobacteria bacterium]|nr:cytochrome b/b6 domain-containing protein [Gammaproteobacteria bacterium]
MPRKIKVWDIATRTFHWSLVVCFFVAYATGDDENMLHIYSSYMIIGLLGFRLIWGTIGPRYVRFSNFILGFKATLAYLQSILLGRPVYYPGHNPLGGWMILLLLVTLTLTSWTGLELYAQQGKGPLASTESNLLQTAHANGKRGESDEIEERLERENEKGQEWLEELHEALASFNLLLVFIHVAGVILAGWLHNENLIKAMWTGYKTPPNDFKSD